MILETLVIGTGAALRRHPRDLTRIGVFDVAGLAMHAVRGIDLQFFSAAAVIDHFIDAGGTKVGAWIAELRYATRCAQRGISHTQMHRLVFIVRRRGEEYEREAVAG